jgi:hypothetical protein
MFREKGDDARERVSMTRVVAFMFAVVACKALWDGAGIGWPFAWLATVTLLAVPLQALLRGTRGADVAIALLSRFGVGGSAAPFGPVPQHGVTPSPDYTPPPGFVTDADRNELEVEG